MGYTIALLLSIHFIADFLLQSREMGTKKSSELKWLMAHLAIQFAAFAIVLLPMYGSTGVILAALNTVIHGVIDWNIWRLYKLSVRLRLYDYGDNKLGHSLVSNPGYLGEGGGEWRFWQDHLFYTTIGLDQLLHGLTIVALVEILL